MKNYTLFIDLPMPKREKKSVWPIFIPFAGCKTKCVFCNQNLSTGKGKVNDIKRLVDGEFSSLIYKSKENNKKFNLGFFGGTFTGLSLSLQENILAKAFKLKKRGILEKVFLSTRPDFISREVVELLAKYEVDLVELGIQSFNSKVLFLSRRDYNLAVILKAIGRLRRKKINYGFQLLPGLPKHTPDIFLEDIKLVIDLEPQTVRLYPCLVLKNTLLASWYEQQEYRPWSLEKTIFFLAIAVKKIWEHKIKILRIGLTPEKDLLANLIAGPWHPALGFLVKSAAFKMFLEEKLIDKPQVKEVYLPLQVESLFWGYEKKWKRFWNKKGIDPALVKAGPYKQIKVIF